MNMSNELIAALEQCEKIMIKFHSELNGENIYSNKKNDLLYLFDKFNVVKNEFVELLIDYQVDEVDEKKEIDGVDEVDEESNTPEEDQKILDELNALPVEDETKPKELWKKIPLFPKYMISNYGNLRTHKGSKVPPNKKKSKFWRYMLYKKTEEKKKKKRFHFFAHELVAMAFIDNPKKFKEVKHKDGNILNNYVDNLEWIPSPPKKTKSSEKSNGLKKIKFDEKKKENNKKTKKVIRIDVKTGHRVIYDSLVIACRENNTKAHSIKPCLKGDRVSYLGFKWEYTPSPKPTSKKSKYGNNKDAAKYNKKN